MTPKTPALATEGYKVVSFAFKYIKNEETRNIKDTTRLIPCTAQTYTINRVTYLNAVVTFTHVPSVPKLA